MRHSVPPVPDENFGHSADVARLKGWTVGTRLEGDEGYGPTVIEITAIGEREVLAKNISHDGQTRTDHREGLWTFSCRDWQIVARGVGFDEECEDCDDDPIGCVFPGKCLMPGVHLESECCTAEMMEQMREADEA